MSEDYSREFAEDTKAKRVERQPVQPAADPRILPTAGNLPAYPTSLLNDPRLNGRGNQPVRVALMREMQQTYGNRAVQRYLQRLSHSGSTTNKQVAQVQKCGGEVHAGCDCAAGLSNEEQEVPSGTSHAIQRQPAATAPTSTATAGSQTSPTPQDTAQDAIGYLQRMSGFVRTTRDSARAMMMGTPGHPVSVEERRRTHSMLNQERVGRFLQQARSTYQAQLRSLPANDARRVQLYDAYVGVLGEIHGAADMALNVSNRMDAATSDAERPLYAQNIAQCVVSGPVTSTLGSTPASQSSALPADVLAAHAKHVKGGNMQGALQVVVDVMKARGEIEDRLMAAQAVTGREPDCENTNAFIVSSTVNGANTTSCGCSGPDADHLPNPRIRIRPDMISRAETLHSTLLHEFRHVRQSYEDCNRPANSPTGGGICTDCNDPHEMDAYLAQVEAGYDRQEIRSGWVRVYTNWGYLAPEQQQVFQARRDAARQKVEGLFPGVDWEADSSVVTYSNWCRGLAGGAHGTCDLPIAPLNKAVPAAGQRRR